MRRNSTPARYARQAEFIDISELDETYGIGIIGLGNIGSHLALNLARVGVEVFNLYDSDRVELHNTSSQSYSERDIGRYKVEVVAEQIKNINPNAIVFVHPNAKERSPHWVSVNDYIAVCVDSMTERKKLASVVDTWGNVYPRNVMRVIDVRVGGEQIDVFNVTSGRHRFTIRDNADTEPCGAEFIAYVSSMAGALGAREVVDSIRADVAREYTRIGERAYSIDVHNMQMVQGV